MTDTTCRICGNTKFEILLKDIKTALGEAYSVLQCINCSFAFTHPLPSQETLEKYYNALYWSRAEGSGVGVILSTLFKLRMGNVLREIKQILPSGARILDWGAGNGDMVRLLNQSGFDCVGIDLYSVPKTEQSLINATIETAPFEKESFDAITCIHVLEHIENPVKSIKKAFSLLKPNGILVIEVPNIDSSGFKLFRKRWQPLEIPTHLNHFNLRSLEKLFKIADNSEIIKVDYFSHRVSPSALIVSLMPFFSAKKMRSRYNGKYPLHLMVIYLLLQLAVYPFVFVESLLKKGAVIRITVNKLKK